MKEKIKQLKIKYNIRQGVKPSYEYVKEYFELFGYKLLTKDYENDRQHLDYVCPKGHKHYITFLSFKRGSRCGFCKKSIKYTYEHVKDIIEKTGHKLLSKKYINKSKLLRIQCEKGHISKLSLHSFQRRITKKMQCKQCIANKLRGNINIVKVEAKRRGHEVLSNEYVTAKTRIKIKCEKGHIFTTTWDKYRSNPLRSERSNGCRKCGIEKNSLSGNVRYKGHSPVKNWVRMRLHEWKLKSMESTNYSCFITGKSGIQLQIHHVTNFNKLFYESIKELELPDYKTIEEYTESQLFKLEHLVQSKHTELGIPMALEVHKLFHSVYGKEDNTMEQVIEFKNNYKLKAIL